MTELFCFFKFFALLSCERENSAENEAVKNSKDKKRGNFKNIFCHSLPKPICINSISGLFDKRQYKWTKKLSQNKLQSSCSP